jgi:3-oxoacyl-[acyl-carrier-protein] synthase II
MIGHTIRPAGAISSRVLPDYPERHHPPTINYREKDPECDLDYVPNQPAPPGSRTCSPTRSGLAANACLTLKRYG